MSSWFITGTDTGVGKTRVSAALLHGLRARGLTAVGMKPVAAGAERDAQGGLSNEDVIQLRAAASFAVPPELDNPYLLSEPLSPHLAAAHEGVQIDVPAIVAAYAGLRLKAEAVVIEGAGGFIVPLSDTATSADLAQRLALPVILVVGLRLGCLNHALLTQEAIERRGLKLAGWVANHIDPAMQAQAANVATLQRLLHAPMLADWPHAPGVEPAALTLDLSHLLGS